MKPDNVILWLIGLSFVGFLIGLVGKNTNNHKKKSFRFESFFTWISIVSVTTLIILAFLYTILYT